MLDLSPYLNLPLTLAGIIGIAIFLYVLLDGFDLGVGILFPFAPSDDCRHKMINSIVPFWDGNETWLVMGGGGLFAAFPLAYAIIFPALYMPIILMLLGLIFRGVAFEFRFKAIGSQRKFWDLAFHFGSLVATFCQGVMLGAFIAGLSVEGRSYIGGSFDWISPFAFMTGVAVVFGYALLGSTWLIMKTEGATLAWARKVASYVLLYVVVFMGLVSLWVPFLYQVIEQRWFTWPNFLYLSPIPTVSLILTARLFYSLLKTNEERLPFILSILLFLLCYAGLGISLWPWIVPYHFTIFDAAAHPSTQTLELIGIVILLPFILTYTFYSYYVFRGKSSSEETY